MWPSMPDKLTNILMRHYPFMRFDEVIKRRKKEIKLAGKYSKAPAPKVFPMILSLTKVRSFVHMLSSVLWKSVGACAATFRDVK